MKQILILFFISTLYACSNKPHIVKPVAEFDAVKDREVYVTSHGWHTGFVIPAVDMQERIPELKLRFPDSKYIEFGWGDKGFYQSSEITSGLTLRAIFWPTESVIHAVALSENPYSYFSGSQVEKVCLSEKGYASLLQFIENSFFKTNTNKLVMLKSGIYGDSQFYKGEGDYYLMNTCNKWTAKGLSSTGLGISTAFKLTASSVMDYLESESRVLAKDRKSVV